MRRGNVILEAADARYLAERESVHVTNRCANCDWTTSGTLLETREAFTQHRLEAHPEVQPPTRHKRRRFVGQMNLGKNLDDNIAATRQQGASGWAGNQ